MDIGQCVRVPRSVFYLANFFAFEDAFSYIGWPGPITTYHFPIRHPIVPSSSYIGLPNLGSLEYRGSHTNRSINLQSNLLDQNPETDLCVSPPAEYISPTVKGNLP